MGDVLCKQPQVSDGSCSEQEEVKSEKQDIQTKYELPPDMMEDEEIPKPLEKAAIVVVETKPEEVKLTLAEKKIQIRKQISSTKHSLIYKSFKHILD
jgi:hypothetical protein